MKFQTRWAGIKQSYDRLMKKLRHSNNFKTVIHAVLVIIHVDFFSPVQTDKCNTGSQLAIYCMKVYLVLTITILIDTNPNEYSF